MSTVRANNYYDASGGSNAVFSGVASPPNSMGFRNRIINGDMRIDQRNAGASVTIPAGNTYVMDRFFGGASQGSKYSMQQNAGAITGPTGFRNYLGVTSLSAYSPLSTDDFSIQHNIEGFNLADLNWGSSNAQPATLSFWVRSSLTGNFGVALRNYGTWNFSYVASYTINAANTWEYKTVAIPAPTTGTFNGANNSGAVNIAWDLGCGTGPSGSATGAWQSGNFQGLTGGVKLVSINGATLYITGVQLEAGTVASPFERRDYGRELAMCQRYFEKSIADGTAADAITNPAPTLIAAAYSSGTVRTQIFYKVPKRATPTITTIPSATVGTGNQWGWYNGSWNGRSTSVAQSNPNAFSVDISLSPSTTTSFSATIIDGNWYASAEL